ncbi:MAG: hypothetical protein WCA46_26130, partial [Actinocatenispora sp.]
MTGTLDREKALDIYLNDHLAGASGGCELARRLADAHQDQKNGSVLRRIADEVSADRESLIGIMRRHDVPVRRLKVLAGLVGERLGRLKLNGRLLFRSPLSSLIELELMRIGVQGKAAAWYALREAALTDDRFDRTQLDTLIERAEDQVRTLEDLRREAAR